MTHLYAAFVRHADYRQPPGVPSAQLPYPLTPEGEAQSVALGDELAELVGERDWALQRVLHSSSLLRAWQTAQLAARRLGERLGVSVEVAASDALHERSVGSAANLTVAEIEAAVAEDPRCSPLPAGWKSSAEVRLPFPGAESLAEAGQRVARHVRTVLAELRGRLERDTLVVFIGHGASIRHAGVHLGIFESYAEARRVSMFHARPVTLRTEPGGGWERVAGDWKPRKQETRID